jgi:CubicO group peptidase (beta-lactamase class C family)
MKRVLAALLLAGCASRGAVDADDLMHAYAGDVPGASLLVIRDGRAVVRKSYGLANLEERTAATPSTNYRLASVTKQFTAASILFLAHDGKLSIDDPIRKWFPALGDDVTIRHLLTHTSGLVDYEDVMPEGTTTQIHDIDVLHLLEQHQQRYFAPGTSYRYSNSGYALLALIVEKASGQTFASFLRDRIFQPLGMNDTVAFEDGISTVTHRAYGYSRAGDGWTRTDQSTTSAVLGDGGIYSSIDDLAKWDAALYTDERLRAAFEPATATNDPNIRYGFGWRITADSLWHTGETRGFRNVILRYPARRVTVVLLTNRNEGKPYDTALEIAKRF